MTVRTLSALWRTTMSSCARSRSLIWVLALTGNHRCHNSLGQEFDRGHSHEAASTLSQVRNGIPTAMGAGPSEGMDAIMLALPHHGAGKSRNTNGRKTFRAPGVGVTVGVLVGPC